MGGMCSSGIAYTASVEVKADADTMWSIVSDLQATADAVSSVQNFAYLDRGRKSTFEVGTTVRETRVVYKNCKTVIRRQIIAISDSNSAESHSNSRSVSFSTSLDNRNSSVWADFSNTSTLTVVALNDKTCELVGSMAVKANGILFACGSCCWNFVNGSGNKHFEKELNDMAIAAEKKVATSDAADQPIADVDTTF